MARGTPASRRDIARIYQERLGEIPSLVLPPPPVEEGVYYDVFQNYEIEAEGRDALRAHLTERGIETMVTWGGRGVHMFKNLGMQHFTLPRTDLLFERVLLLPMFVELTDEQAHLVCDEVEAFYQEHPEIRRARTL